MIFRLCVCVKLEIILCVFNFPTGKECGNIIGDFGMLL